MKLSSDSLSRHLEQQLLPAYLISGDEPLLAGEAADAVRARARAAGFTEREVHFMDRGADWEAVRTAVNTLSLFAARRLIEVRLPSGKPGTSGARTLVAVLDSLASGDVLLLILTGRLDRDAHSSEWVRAAESRGAWVSVWPLPAERMPAWIESRSRRLGLNLEREAIGLLAERTQGNLLAAQQELDKLALLAPHGRIGAAEVLASSADSARFELRALTDALEGGQCARALRALAGLRAEGTELPLVLWAAIRALHAPQTGPRPAPAPRPERELARLRRRALRADAMAKGRMSGDAWDELALLAAELCGRPALPLPA